MPKFSAIHFASLRKSSSESFSVGMTRFVGSTRTPINFAVTHASNTGLSVAWIAYKGPTRGSAQVYVDGVLKATVSLYATTYSARPQVYAFNWATSGSHSIKVVVVGTAGHPRVDIDAFARLVPA